ncbi:uncharacterized protein LOC125044551 [Penaeus chinensis]|uniref:uncharacterized protein LOC125044551 n=1 Tax=Penaeus chinensis TaxID=139456 RepID=UPI001FB74A75|nr:uncharacterized protein LOC125044551 [Penaeus chinensis]
MRVLVPVILAAICLEAAADPLPWRRSQDSVPGYEHRSHSHSPGLRGPPWRGEGDHGRLNYGSSSDHGHPNHGLPGHGHLGSSSSSAPVYGQRNHSFSSVAPGSESQFVPWAVTSSYRQDSFSYPSRSSPAQCHRPGQTHFSLAAGRKRLRCPRFAQGLRKTQSSCLLIARQTRLFGVSPQTTWV